MKTDHIIFYIPYFNQDQTINWIDTFISVYNKKYGSMFLLDPRMAQFPGFKASLMLLIKNKVDWLRVVPKFSPFFGNTTFINYFIFLFFFKLYLLRNFKNKKIVVLMGYHNRLLGWYLKIISPDLLIVDVCDYWEEGKLRQVSRITKHAITNSKPLHYLVSKYMYSNMISAGYFSLHQIKNIAKNYSFSIKNAIFIGTIDWRTNLSMLKYTMEQLPDFTFNFFYKEQFDNLSVTSKYNPKLVHFHRLNQKGKKIWTRIKKLPNFKGKVVLNQEELSKIKLYGSVGLICYTNGYDFNTYCHPIKFYDYAACGLPIVTTKLQSIQGLYQNLLMTNDRNTYVANILKANELAWKRNDIKKSIALNHTHELKANQVHTLIKDLLKK